MSFYHKRLAEFEVYDEIRLVTEERWKDSELSGSEYRYSVATQFFFKGLLIKTGGAGDMLHAMLLLGRDRFSDDFGIPAPILKQEERCCDNVHCPELATKWFALKRQTSDNGHWLADEGDGNPVPYRQFCDRHAHRGDCSREDCDDNYTAIPKPE